MDTSLSVIGTAISVNGHKTMCKQHSYLWMSTSLSEIWTSLSVNWRCPENKQCSVFLWFCTAQYGFRQCSVWLFAQLLLWISSIWELTVLRLWIDSAPSVNWQCSVCELAVIRLWIDSAPPSVNQWPRHYFNLSLMGHSLETSKIYYWKICNFQLI
jgi:hypothetical protein